MDDDGIAAPENYRGSSSKENPLSFEFIVLEHVHRVLKLSSSDWHGGYFGDKPVVSAGGTIIVERWTESKADAYVNAVLSLYDVLIGHITSEVTNTYTEVQTSIQELQKKYSSQFELGKDDLIAFRYERATIHRRLFRKIMLFLKKSNYLRDNEMEEGIVDE